MDVDDTAPGPRSRRPRRSSPRSSRSTSRRWTPPSPAPSPRGPAVARARARRPGPAAAPLRRRRGRPRRRAGGAGGARRRAHRRQRALGGRQRPRRARLLRRGARAAVRPPDPGRGRPRRHVPRAARRRRDHRAVELPHADRRVGLRARAGGGQHGRAQAGRAHPADGTAAGRAGPGGGPARRACSRCCRARARWSGSGWSPTSRSARSFHRLDRGRHARSCGRPRDQVKRVTLELGGKSANIVFADADVERAAANAPAGVFDNAGQDCCARSRILVERTVYDRFLELLEPAVTGLRVGSPAQAGRRDGPADQRGAAGRVRGFVEGGADAGGAPVDVAFRGTRAGRARVLVPADGACCRARPADPVWREEVFGPVVAVLPFDDEAEAVALANDTEYGLSGSIWTRDLGRALRVARAVESGNLSVNSNSSVRYSTPFGGFKRSGLGRELGPDALDSFTEVKNVFIATTTGKATEGSVVQRFAGSGRRDHRRSRRHRPGHRRAAGVGGRDGGRRRPGRRRREGAGRRARRVVRGRRRDQPGGQRAGLRADARGLRPDRRRVPQRGDLPAGRRLDPRHRPRGVAPGAGREPDLGLPGLQGGAALHAARRARGRSSTRRPSSRRWARRPRRSPTPRARAACWR